MATLAAVAAHAKVGIGTVSRVLNGSPNVSPAMRERVLAAMAELGYDPNRRKRADGSRRHGYIGVLVTYFDEPSAFQRLRGIVSAPAAATATRWCCSNVVSPSQVAQRVEEIPTHPLDGLIVLSMPLSAAHGEKLASGSVPDGARRHDGAQSPHRRHRRSARWGRSPPNHLLDLGHRRIGFIGEPPSNAYGFVAGARRQQGYRAALANAGVEPSQELIRYGAHLRSAAKQMTLDLLSLPNPPTAIVATSDVQAVGVLEAATSLGRKVPDDLSVVGYDDIELAALMGLTTVRQPLEGSGMRGADLVLDAISADIPPLFTEELEIELVVRSTTAPLR